MSYLVDYLTTALGCCHEASLICCREVIYTATKENLCDADCQIELEQTLILSLYLAAEEAQHKLLVLYV